MGFFIAIVVIFLIMFLLGVPKSIISLIGLGLLLIVAFACAVFFLISALNLFRTKRESAIFDGFGVTAAEPDESADNEQEENNYFPDYIDRTKESLSEIRKRQDTKNKIHFAFYMIGREKVQNLFPTDSIMKKFYNIEETVTVRTCTFRKKRYCIDGITLVIIGVGFPVFTLLTIFLAYMVMQYSYIFLLQ